ncbi:MAG: hypothetical protein ACRDHY_01480, partial [Anaerolineales bacterium]
SFTMADLASFLDDPVPVAGLPLAPRQDVEQAVEGAEWLVFSILDPAEGVYGSDSLKLLLDRRPDLVRSKRLVVFALDVPYGLDATDISHIDLYYGLYYKSPPFIDVAARLLFEELGAPGAPPVSVPGVGYDLIETMQPDPGQVIELFTPASEASQGSPTPGPRGFQIGDAVMLESGVIVDGNQHPVPDGTPVDFWLQYQDFPEVVLQAETVGGIAQTSARLDRLGRLQIRAESGPARASEILELNVQEGVQAFVTVIAPTEAPSPLPEPTGTVFGPTATAEAGAVGAGAAGSRVGLGVGGLILGLLGSGVAGATSFQLAARRGLKREEGTRWALAALVGGLAGYNYLALGLPGGRWLMEGLGDASIVIMVVFGAGVASWEVWREKRRRMAGVRPGSPPPPGS